MINNYEETKLFLCNQVMSCIEANVSYFCVGISNFFFFQNFVFFFFHRSGSQSLPLIKESTRITAKNKSLLDSLTAEVFLKFIVHKKV